MISRLRLLLPTLWRLGPGSVASVAAYRLACRLGLYCHRFPVDKWDSDGDFYCPDKRIPPTLSRQSRESLLTQADRLLAGELCYFSGSLKGIGNPPDWFLDPFSGSQLCPDGHWSTLDEFSTGDIKNVWEASRFEWVLIFARVWRLTGDDRYLSTLNSWLLDWVTRNPANAGPNWKCGQEASIRLINLLLAARLLGAHKSPAQSLINLVAIHCDRIMPTIRYAIAQNNNHGTSEAAALFVGGAWLGAFARDVSIEKRACRWRDVGRRWLEDRVTKLVSADGSFSQYSVNYHRVLIDTLCQVEYWRRELEERPFSDRYTGRCRAAVEWLASMTDVVSGNAPNLGANDGARLYDLSSSSYRDFRPSVQLASVLFRGERVYDGGACDEPLAWLGVESLPNLDPASTTSCVHGDGGYVILHGDNSHGVIRFARFGFRPSHADCLHLDLRCKGRNILRDGGTFSYNTEPRWLEYFSGTESHNTVQFDDRDQMPRIGRFLFGDWLEMAECTGIQQDSSGFSWAGAYVDGQKSYHRRTVSVRGNLWRVVDEIHGHREKATLRWRLIPESWSLQERVCDCDVASLEIVTSAPVRRVELVAGWESLHYQEKTELPVLEVEVGPGQWTVETRIVLKD